MLNSFFRITLVTTSFLFIFQPEIRSESLVNNEVCEAVRSPIVASIIEDINLLSEVSLIQLNCKSIAKINSIDDDSVLLTTTRKRGKEYICLHASGNTRPCQVKLGVVTSSENPNDVLCKLTRQECSNISEGPLTETVERLYLRPSSLIR